MDHNRVLNLLYKIGTFLFLMCPCIYPWQIKINHKKKKNIYICFKFHIFHTVYRNDLFLRM